jgi:L-threonylcarbamoyladenylate synthase
MSTVLRVKPDDPSDRVIATAVDIIEAGGLLAYPTDTVYGLGTNALNPQAVRKIYAVKKRPFTQPLPVAVSGRPMAAELAYVTDRAHVLIARFWPGALTLVLKKRPRTPLIVTGGRVGVGVRAPNHQVPLTIMNVSYRPLITTSANKHGGRPCVTAEEVKRHFDGEVDLILDGGRCAMAASTVLDLVRNPPVLIRQGVITRNMIEDVIGIVDEEGSGPQ